MIVIESIIKKQHVTIIKIIKRVYYNIKETYITIYEDEKYIKRAQVKNRYHNLPEDKMLELKAYQKEYQKKYREMKKAQGNLAKNAVQTP